MIELSTKVHAIRRSKIAFWTVATIVGLTTAVIGSAVTAAYRAVAYGLLAGAVAGFLAAFVLFCWPAIRVVWHWAAEVTSLTALLGGYLMLTAAVSWWAALAILTTTIGTVFAFPAARRRTCALVMCAVSRHRLRVCFAAFISSTHTGMTPLILFARPIPAGERVWIWLRPGLALADLENRLDRLAAGCWAAECRIAPASRGFSALLRLDIARRNPLTGLVGSPLPDLIPTSTVHTAGMSGAVPDGLDLADTPEPTSDSGSDRKRPKALPTIPAQPQPALRDVLGPTVRGDADLADWI